MNKFSFCTIAHFFYYFLIGVFFKVEEIKKEVYRYIPLLNFRISDFSVRMSNLFSDGDLGGRGKTAIF